MRLTKRRTVKQGSEPEERDKRKWRRSENTIMSLPSLSEGLCKRGDALCLLCVSGNLNTDAENREYHISEDFLKQI